MSNFVQVMLSLDEAGRCSEIGSARVDEDFFRTLQSPAGDRSCNRRGGCAGGHEKVAVISHSLVGFDVRRRAGCAGESLMLDKTSYRIVGVMPADFGYPFGSDLPYGDSQIKSTQIWVPLVLNAAKRSERRARRQCDDCAASAWRDGAIGADGDGRDHGATDEAISG